MAQTTSSFHGSAILLSVAFFLLLHFVWLMTVVQLNTIPKDLTLPAPVPIKTAPRYIFGDLSERAYAPSDNWTPRVVDEENFAQ